MQAAAVVAEVGPPLSADEPRLAGEEFAIHAAAIGDNASFPFPELPFPAAVGQLGVAAIVVDYGLGSKAIDAAVEQRQEANLLDVVGQLRGGVNVGVGHGL